MSATQERHVRYDGSTCLNLRSITDAFESLTGMLRGKPMPRKELANLLWFVETCIMSKRLYFDGTLPKEEVVEAQEVVGGFLQTHFLPEVKIDPISFADETHILHHAAAAIAESSLILSEFSFESGLDRDVSPEDHEAFLKVVTRETVLDEATRNAQAIELVQKRFRGSKCLAGLVSAGPEAMARVRKLYQIHPNRGCLVTGAVINRFRLNYLNQLASHKQGAYAPNPNFEPVTKLHHRKFQDYLMMQLAKEGVRAGADLLGESLHEQTALPPVGLYALMLTRERDSPIAVLKTAIEKFKPHHALLKVIWGHTKTGLELRARKQQLDQYHKEVDEYFLTAYRRLKEEAEGIREAAGWGERVRKYTIPALFAALAGLVPTPGQW